MEKYVLFFTLIWFSLDMVSTQDCSSFNDVAWRNSYRCKPNCLKEGTITGTTIYSPDSSICSAAVHAGVIDTNENRTKEVSFSKINSNTGFVGSVRNRRVSDSFSHSYRTRSSKNGGFTFTSDKFIPTDLNEESWMTDVYLIHNNYNSEFTSSRRHKSRLLWLACLWDSNSTEGLEFDVFRWNHKKFPGDGSAKPVKDKMKKRVVVRGNSFNNLRAFICHGKHPYSDVSGILSYTTYEKFLAENVSNVGILGGNLTVKMRVKSDNFVYLRRFPDDRSEAKNFPLPLYFENLDQTDNALYIAGGANDKGEFERESAYFEIIVKECPDNLFGEGCKNRCNCGKNGVCHPVIGSCVCRAGFYGARCERRCPLDSFGSYCQFSCGREHFGNEFSHIKRNCRGLTFCLPKPLGCTCAFGYEGYLCDEFSNLTFPYLNQSPSVKMTSDTEIEIQFDEWKEGQEGFTYGLQISSYSIYIENLKRGEVKPSKKVLKYKTSISPYNIHGIKILIDLKDFNDTERPLPNFSPLNNVSLPCFVWNKSQLFNVIKQERKILLLSYQIPFRQVDFKGCFFKATSKSEYQTEKQSFTCQNTTLSSTVLCEFVNLPSGTNFEIQVACENKIGKCTPAKNTTFTLPNVDDFVEFDNFQLTVEKFANFEETEMSVWKLRNVTEEQLQTLKPEKIIRIGVDLAQKDDFIRNEEDRIYSFSLEKIAQESKPFQFIVLLENKIQNYYSVSRLFLSNETSSGNGKYVYIAIFFIVILLLLVMVFLLRKRIQKGKFFKNIFGGKTNDPPELEISAPTTAAKNSTVFKNPKKFDKDRTKCYTNDEIIANDDKKVLFRKGKKNDVYSNDVRNDDVIPDYENLRNSSSFEEGLEIYLNSLINSPKTTEAFHSIPKDCGKPCTVATHIMNKMKNRYINNLPYDDTRVVLSKLDNDPYSDYVNASIMNGINNRKWYISTQGPKNAHQNTIPDFWRMIVEARIDFIIMVANFYEKGKLKVGEYFREGDVLEFGGIYVAVLERLQHPHFIRSVIQVTYSTPDLKTTAKDVVHYQFIKWPDHGVPNQIFPLVFMIQSVLQEYKEGGITIHCSAGIGRTGTILLVLLLKEFYEAATWIDPISVLRNMRETRAGLVENIQQFNLSLLLLYECIYGKLGSVNANEIDTNWDNYLTECSKLFERLMKQPISHTYTFGEYNIDYNRNPAILPSDNHVIFYGKLDTGKNSDYLNAISIDIEDMLNSIIVTEHPLPSTLYNFWKMIFAKKCSYLCMLNSTEPSEDFPSILPLEEGVADFGHLALHVASSEGSSRFVSSQYVVTLSSRHSSHSVNVIQILDWKPEEEYPASLSQLEGIASFVKEKANSKAPIVLCCSDGVTACGLVTAAVNVVNRIDVYQELNIYNSVLRIRRCRPEFLTSKNQFLKLYEVANLYIENNASYQNFQ